MLQIRQCESAAAEEPLNPEPLGRRAPGMITGRLRSYFPDSVTGLGGVGGVGVGRYRPWSHLTAHPMARTSVTMIEHMKYVLFVRDIGQGGG